MHCPGVQRERLSVPLRRQHEDGLRQPGALHRLPPVRVRLRRGALAEPGPGAGISEEPAPGAAHPRRGRAVAQQLVPEQVPSLRPGAVPAGLPDGGDLPRRRARPGARSKRASASPAPCAPWSAPSTPSPSTCRATATPARVVATKCDGCIDRVARGDEPACVEACKIDALVFGELNELIHAGRVRDSAPVLTVARTPWNRPDPRPRTTSPAGGAGARRPPPVAEGVSHDHTPSR